jgi:hypothetical protein
MWRLPAILLLALSASLVCAPDASAQSSPVALYGYVKTRDGQPISALAVYLYHPALGRSYPRFTDADGYFAFERLEYTSSPYYLEVYWGSRLMYREAVMLDRIVRWPDIILG